MDDDYDDMTKRIEELVMGLYEDYGPVSLAVTLLTTVAAASLHGYSSQIKETIERALGMLRSIQEDKGTLQ